MNAFMKPLTNRIEIVFWDLFNNSLSQSDAVRKSIRYMASINWIEKPSRVFGTLCLLAVTGFFSGVALAYLVFKF